MTFVLTSDVALRADALSIVAAVVVQQEGLVGGAVAQAGLRDLGEGDGYMPPHAVGAHVDLLEAAITIDPITLLTQHISQGPAFLTPGLV